VLLEEFALSHKLSVPDALIAATALSQGIPLYTLNRKDFRFIPNLNFISFSLMGKEVNHFR